MSEKTSLHPFIYYLKKSFFPEKRKECTFCAGVSVQVVKTEPLVSNKFSNLASPVPNTNNKKCFVGTHLALCGLTGHGRASDAQGFYS